MTVTVINRRATTYTPGPRYVSIMRPSIFGNPFVLHREAERGSTIKDYREWLLNQPSVLAAIEALPEDAVLVCCCKPRPCHGDVIAEIKNRLTTSATGV